MSILRDTLVAFGLREPDPVVEPTPLEIASAQLATTERELLRVEHHKDEVDAELAMLKARRARLKALVKQLAKEDAE